MSKKKTSKTIDGARFFICKSCGCAAKESMYLWKQKPLAQKNICSSCRKRKELRKAEARESARYNPFYFN